MHILVLLSFFIFIIPMFAVLGMGVFRKHEVGGTVSMIMGYTLLLVVTIIMLDYILEKQTTLISSMIKVNQQIEYKDLLDDEFLNEEIKIGSDVDKFLSEKNKLKDDEQPLTPA